MTKELEIAAAAAAGGLAVSGTKAGHGACLNCGGELQGPWCHACGQKADDHHRSILRLAWEGVEGLTHLDGRIARTLPALIFRPGRLARDYVEGRLNRHIPPFRLFLVSLLIFTFTTEFVIRQGPSPAARDRAAHRAASALPPAPSVARKSAANTDTDVVETKLDTGASPIGKWLQDHVRRAVANRDLYLMIVFEWAHRLAFLMLPILAAQLTLLYVYRRKFYVYDHLLVAMQYLSFCFLLWSLAWIASDALEGVLFVAAFFWTPVNLFLTLRGAYGSSIAGALLKSLFLWISTGVVFSLLIVGLLVIALGQV